MGVFRRAALAAALGGVWFACTDSASTTKTYVVVGDIDVVGGKPSVQAPATAQAGSGAVIVVTTVGAGCYTVHSTEVDETTDGGDVTPYDQFVTAPNTGCPANRIMLTHTAALQFPTPGSKTVTVHSGTGTNYPITIDVQ